MNELVTIKSTDIAAVFSKGGADPIVQKIRDEVTGAVPDTSTLKGRNEIASLAHKVARSKTYLDGLGKDLVAGIKLQAKVIDAERKKMRDELDDLKTEVRQPLTDWEEAERKRVSDIRTYIFGIAGDGEHCRDKWDELSIKEMWSLLAGLEHFIANTLFDEFKSEALTAFDISAEQIKDAIAKRQKYDAEQAELEKLRAEQAEREQAEREESLRREGEERMRLEAKVAADEAVRRAEAAVQAEIEAKQLAIRRERHAKAQAKANAEAAVKRERDRIAQEKAAEEKAKAKREANKAHRRRVLDQAIEALISAGLTLDAAVRAIDAITKGDVPFVEIHF